MADIKVTVDGGDAEDRIRRLALALTDLRSFWPRVVPLFISWTRRQFESEGAFYGRPWAPLSEAYADRKRMLWGERPILQMAGDLRRETSTPKRTVTATSLTLEFQSYVHSAVFGRDRSGETFSSTKKIDPRWFQEGTSKMPARRLLSDTLPPLARQELQAEANAYVRDLLGRF